MRVLLTSYGSVGDIMPFVALAQALGQRGHSSVFALPDYLIPYVSRYDFECVPTGPDLGQVYRSAQVLITEGLFSQEQAAVANRTLTEIAPVAIETLSALASQADVLIGLYHMPFVDIVQRRTRVPVVSLRVAYPGYENPAAVATNVRTLGPQLYAFSRAVLLPDPTWPKDHHLTGFFFLDEESFQPPPELSAFVERGAAPVVITLGSMAHADPAHVSQVFLDAISRVGCRAIIQQGWSGLANNRALPESIYAATYIPHSWLFSRAACIVHHGGAGTTAAALRAGRPMIIIPHGLDQCMIAQRVQLRGCVGGVIPYQELTVERVAEALATTINNPRLQNAARIASTLVQKEKGVEKACELIETMVSSIGGSSQTTR